jgi:hypothetical protein
MYALARIVEPAPFSELSVHRTKAHACEYLATRRRRRTTSSISLAATASTTRHGERLLNWENCCDA